MPSGNDALTSVAAQVQADTIPEAMSPGFTLREALLNSSELLGEKPVYRDWIAVNTIMKALKNRPIPVVESIFTCRVEILYALILTDD